MHFDWIENVFNIRCYIIFFFSTIIEEAFFCSQIDYITFCYLVKELSSLNAGTDCHTTVKSFDF